MERLDFADIEAAVAVAKGGSFEAGAAALGISTSSIRQAIRRLEERESVALFVREGRRNVPTEACSQWLESIIPAFSGVRDLLRQIELEQKEGRGPLRLVVDSNVAGTVISKAMPAFLKKHPGITLDLFVSDATIDLASRRADAGICRYSDIPMGMIANPIGPANRRLVVGTPDYFVRNGVPKLPGDLTDHNALRFDVPGEPSRPWIFWDGKKALSVTCTGSLITNSRELLLDALRRGIGLCQLDERLVMKELSSGSLVAVLEEWSLVERNWSLFYPERTGMPSSLQCFINYLKELRIAR